MRFSIVFVLALLALSTVRGAAESARDAIQTVLRRQQEAWNKADLEKFMEGYAKTETLRFASGGTVQYGWKATLDRYKAKYPDKAAMGLLTFSDIEISVLGDDAALVFGRWQLQRQQDSPRGLFTLLFRRTKEGWRIVHDHTSVASE